MTRNELKALIETSDDIMFGNEQIGFTIMCCYDEGIMIGVQHKRGEIAPKEEYFQTADELIDNYSVNGVRLKDIISSMNIQSYA